MWDTWEGDKCHSRAGAGESLKDVAAAGAGPLLGPVQASQGDADTVRLCAGMALPT